jgi:hypothetical protein
VNFGVDVLRRAEADLNSHGVVDSGGFDTADGFALFEA